MASAKTFIEYSSQSSFARAFLTGLVNTIVVSAHALVLATVIGFAVGIGSLSTNQALRRVCLTYVALFRNVPLLLQLYLWYSIATGLLPTPAEAWGAFGVQISRVGIFLPMLHLQPTALSTVAGLVAAIAVGLAVWRYVFDRRAGVVAFLAILAAALLAGTIALVVAGGASFELSVWQKFRFNGGIKFSPEFSALLVGLSIYSGSFIAEIVRTGILAVKKGQKEAAQALGLSPGQTMRYIVIPQASRVIIPPLTSQYLNLVKNSSLGVAIGYPDLVSIGNTTLNITGRAHRVRRHHDGGVSLDESGDLRRDECLQQKDGATDTMRLMMAMKQQTSWRSRLISVAVIAVLAVVLFPLFRWAVLEAVWGAKPADACDGVGACWPVIAEKATLIIFGRYPASELWRPALASALLLGTTVATALPRFWGKGLLAAWIYSPILFFVLMGGGVAGLSPVPWTQWGGLPITIMLSVFGIGFAFPIGILLACAKAVVEADRPLVRDRLHRGCPRCGR